MKRICAWCGKPLGETDAENVSDEVITHGVCRECAFRLTAQAGMSLREFVEGFDAPVMAVDAEGRVLTANAKTRDLLGVELSGIEGHMCGDVFECEHSMLPEGRGGTVHCLGCAIRRAVTETHATGKSCVRLPAHVSRKVPDAAAPVRYLVSTEKAGDIVLLRIDEVDKGKP